MKRVHISKVSLHEDGLNYCEGQPFSGVAYSEYDDGSPRSESSFKDGLGHGLSRGWHKNGRLASETHLLRDVQHGTCREWNEEGVLEEETTAEFGIVTMERRWENGELVELYELGPEDDDYATLLEYRRLLTRTPAGD